MDMPMALRSAVEELADGVSRNELLGAARDTSQRYRDGFGRGTRLVTTDVEAAAYAAARMPATYGAVYSALQNAAARIDMPDGATLLDVGAGTGAGAWAAAEIFNPGFVTCLEREQAMRNIGAALMRRSGRTPLESAKWSEFDLTADTPLPKADVVLASYVLNELRAEDRLNAAKRLYDAANMLLLIVEPGTPDGWRELMELRYVLTELGGYIVAPCPHARECPVADGDWCHFTCRVARSRLHKALKTGDAPYEDEKFSYIAISKFPVQPAKARVVRHPVIEPGKITLKLCSENGLEQRIVRKKDGALFKFARKCGCGDALPEGE